MTKKRIAIVSVSNTNNLEKICAYLHTSWNIQIVATSRTALFLESHGIPVSPISTITSFPEILDGRVKTIHPNLYAGILAKRDNHDHIQQLNHHHIDKIDFVICNLYPFMDKIKKGGDTTHDEMIELIDIGGPAMIRAAAKNYASVTVVSNPQDYDMVIASMKKNNGNTDKDIRQTLAARVFSLTSALDHHIAQTLRPSQDETPLPPPFQDEQKAVIKLNYGENPDQKAVLIPLSSPEGESSFYDLISYHPQKLSYNNYLDLATSWSIVSVSQKPRACVVKHANPCGVGEHSNDPQKALKIAWECDPRSGFGGIIALNQSLTIVCAEEILSWGFIEAVIAKHIHEDAAALLHAKKPKLRLVSPPANTTNAPSQQTLYRSIPGALLAQEAPSMDYNPDNWKVVSGPKIHASKCDEIILGLHVARILHSNAIVLTDGDDQHSRTIGISGGQPSRIDALETAISRACMNHARMDHARMDHARMDHARMDHKQPKERVDHARMDIVGASLISDGFFPFRDSIDRAAEAGIKTIVQPGGSIRDAEVIKAAKEHDITMILTGQRLFSH